MMFFVGWPILLDFLFVGVISGNVNSPGVCRGQLPGFWKPGFHKKIEFENGLVCFFEVFKVCGAKFQFSGINFSMQFQIK